MNNPNRQIDKIQQALESDKSKIAFLLGAGCPVSIQLKDGDDSIPLIPDIEGLTKIVCEALKDKKIDNIITRIQLPEGNDANIEDILSHIRLLIEVVGKGDIDGFTKIQLEELETEICNKITEAVEKELPDFETPYHKLASWIRGIPRNNHVEIFTPNYDLLIESALESQNIPYFDGFIGSKKAFFDLPSIENEELPERWVKLWKLHGSINWWNDSKGNVFRVTGKLNENKQMIYPSHLKYEESRLMPYFAMQDRLGYFLSSGQAVLITCGYSFVDKHLNSIILQRLLANPHAICFGLLYDDLENYPEALECAKRVTNLSLLAYNGAVVGGQQINWELDKTDEENIYIQREKIEDKTDSIKCSIGNFQILGKFLLNQIGYVEIPDDKDDNNAK